MATRRFMICLILAISVISTCNSAKILGVFTSPAKSHLIIHMAVVKSLADAGHEVTVVSSQPFDDANRNYRFIELDMPIGSIKEQVSAAIAEKIVKPQSFIQGLVSFIPKILDMANASIHDSKFQKLMDEESFDLVVLGYFFNELQLGIAAHFNCPVVINFMIQPFTQLLHFSGTPREVSYVPNLFTRLKQPMGFIERVYNFLHQEILEAALMKYFDYLHQKAYEKVFPSPKYRTLNEMKKNVSLVLVNHHFSQGPVRPLVPAMVEIGGIQIKPKPNPLPEDIQKFIDGGKKNGVIYFSFGTHVQTGSLKPEITKIMFNVLSKLPQRVLWKFDKNGEIPGKSANILYKEWTPQDDVLAHPNIKLFITHGGQGGVVESQYHGVPMMVIPFFGDQHANLKTVEKQGFGRGIEYLTITEDTFRNTLNEVLNNPIYSNKVKTFSSLYKDRPQTARETAVYWIEYVLRHHGAPHMQSPLVHMNFIEKYSIDVIAMLILILFVIVKVFSKIVCLVKSLICKSLKCSKKPKITNKKKQR